jgi:4-amino-4-deoxy-L-arabinose transferase-like glycosyltransferase
MAGHETGSGLGATLKPDMTLVSRAAIGILIAVFLVALVRLTAHASIAFSFPYAFDYGEGVVWQQMRNIVRGEGYQAIGIYPAIAYEYPPLFHLCAAGVARITGIDELYAGRLVSLASAAACAALIARLTAHALTGESRRMAFGAATIAGLAFLTLPLVDEWALLMRIDLLACALSLAGMLLAIHAPRSIVACVAAGLMFTLALYTRQTSLPAPAAAFLVLLAVRPARAWLMAAVSVGSGLAVLVALETATQSGFLLNIVSYNINRIIWDHAFGFGTVLLANVAVIGIGIFGLLDSLRLSGVRRWRDLKAWLANDLKNVTMSVVVATLACKTLMLPAILKSGASDNYLIDWFSEIAIFFGIAMVPVLRSTLRLPAKPNVILLGLVGIVLPLQTAGAGLLPDRGAVEGQQRALDAIVDRIRQAKRPVISDDATLLIRAGQSMRWEPSIVAELGSAGRYDEAKFVKLIEQRRFEFFVTDGDRGDVVFDQRFNPKIIEAIHIAYPRRELIGGRVLHLPR